MRIVVAVALIGLVACNHDLIHLWRICVCSGFRSLNHRLVVVLIVLLAGLATVVPVGIAINSLVDLGAAHDNLIQNLRRVAIQRQPTPVHAPPYQLPLHGDDGCTHPLTQGNEHLLVAALMIIRHQPGTKELECLVDEVGRSFVGQMDHPLGLIVAVVFRLRVVILRTKIGQLFCEGIFFPRSRRLGQAYGWAW